MDPHTGAILALASLPSYDPNHYSRVADPRLYRNLALQNYQPGSTFKIISVAAGLDSGAFTTRTTVNDPGYYQNDGITVHNWEAGIGWGAETPEIMLQHSANVGMAQFATKEGPLRFYRYVINRFGFNAPTGIDLPDESPGYLRSPGHGSMYATRRRTPATYRGRASAKMAYADVLFGDPVPVSESHCMS